MCGITGFLTNDGVNREVHESTLQRMTDALRHRGPDAQGSWHSADGFVHLGHRRLSIVDLTSTGAQPMCTTDARFTLVFNGEIYNFMELRVELQHEGYIFNGTSDTEVLLAAIACWGPAKTLPRLNGMFAFAAWDARDRELWLARDRFGEKPLYYGFHNEVFLFGSELKAIRQHPSFAAEISSSGLASLLNMGYVNSQECIYKNVHKLPPAHVLCVAEPFTGAEPEPFWQPYEFFAGRVDARPQKFSGEPGELERLLLHAVGQRMVADVPLGAFLSGGIDSSTVVAMMQAQSTRPVKTFTIGFWEAGYNEAEDAARVARHLRTEHHEFYLSSRDCVDTIIRLPDIYDEPFGDSSQIPTTLVSEFTRRHVTVALSGDGGDEFFGGYNRYYWTKRLWRRIGRLPSGIRLLGGEFISSVNPQIWETCVDAFNRVLPRRYRVRGGGDKMHKLGRILGATSVDGVYRELVSNRQWAASIAPQYCSARDVFEKWSNVAEPLSDIERMMLLDQMTYMTDDILCKVDRASMATGLEVRVPFLDTLVTNYAWSMPMDLKVHHGVGKWPLRQILKKYVPEKLFERPKMGFGVPIGEWLRGPLRDWAEDLLSARSLAEAFWFDAKAARGAWTAHLSGRRNLSSQLWPLLMFLAWRRKWM
jgi:asparagine synthase (glutamine-hydrolysing)